MERTCDCGLSWNELSPAAKEEFAADTNYTFCIGDRAEAEDKHGRFIVGVITKVGPGEMVTIHDEVSHKHYSVEQSRCKRLEPKR